jgi:hypothetical protein
MVGRKRRAEAETEEDSESRLVGFRAAFVFDRLSRDFRESSLSEAELGKLVWLGG